jgi:hypothetical protein
MDEAVIERAKRYATEQGTSLSRLVENYLGRLTRPLAKNEEDLPPITRRLSGILKGSRLTREDYYRYLERKYR